MSPRQSRPAGPPQPQSPSRRGFTLVELLVVLLIVGLLAAIALPRLLGQRTRARNVAAQTTVRHALVAARSWYVGDGRESYAGLCADASNARGENRCAGKTAISSLESSLGTSEPADSQTPGSSANPREIWMGNGSDGTDPSGNTVVLCAASQGDTIYCIRDVDGVATYLQIAGGSLLNAASNGSWSTTAWLPTGTSGPAPSISSNPTVTGTTVRGQNLSGSVGSWNASPTAYSWQWRRCDSSGNSCNDIAGASGSGSTVSDYTLATADVGSTLRLQVSATNANGASSATSSASTVVSLPAIAVASGNFHNCALLSDNTVRCWGSNDEGQLGNGSNTNSSSPVSVSGINNATAITDGVNSSCALLSTGAVKCWGRNDFGQLGNNSTASSNVPVSVSGLSGASKLVQGAYHTCAHTSGSTVKCWGFNGTGQLGDNSYSHTACSSDCSLVPVTVSGLSGTPSKLGTSYYHSCALYSGGSAECWGYNGNGQLANGGTTNANTATAATSLSSVLQISGGYYFACALISGGTVKCWGQNTYGQLGDGTTTDRNTPATISGLNGVSAIDAGLDHVCALLSDGTAKCWGRNDYGQLGVGDTTNRSTPTAVSGLTGASAISAGFAYRSCALLTTGAVKCWGAGTTTPTTVVGL